MKNSLFRYVCLVVALLICSFADAQQKANYKLAEKFRLLEQNPICLLYTSDAADD